MHSLFVGVSSRSLSCSRTRSRLEVSRSCDLRAFFAVYAFGSTVLKSHSSTGALLFGPVRDPDPFCRPSVASDAVASSAWNGQDAPRPRARKGQRRSHDVDPALGRHGWSPSPRADKARPALTRISRRLLQDMYFGEAEKLVKAVFSIARKLAPCIIFVDELDALFQARTGGGSSGDSVRRQMLTGQPFLLLLSVVVIFGVLTTISRPLKEFMQEMDGLQSASQNREKGLVLIGATNRYELLVFS